MSADLTGLTFGVGAVLLASPSLFHRSRARMQRFFDEHSPTTPQGRGLVRLRLAAPWVLGFLGLAAIVGSFDRHRTGVAFAIVVLFQVLAAISMIVGASLFLVARPRVMLPVQRRGERGYLQEKLDGWRGGPS